MDAEAAHGITPLFDELESPRINRTRAHKLIDLCMIAIVAILGDAEHWTEVELFGRCKEADFRRFLEPPNGIPSHDTFNRVFNRLDPAQLNRCFMRWVQHLAEGLGVQTVALDGKALRGSGDPASGHPPLHLISAWAHEARLILGQITCKAKSNEITAMPELIAMLELKGFLVTVDALNTQRETAETILKREGDYVMALKTNQPKLHEDAVLMLADAEDAPTRFDLDEHVIEDTGHGRVERRRYTTLKLDRCTWRVTRSRWPGLEAIGRVVRERTDRTTGERTTQAAYHLMRSASRCLPRCALVRPCPSFRRGWPSSVDNAIRSSNRFSGSSVYSRGRITRTPVLSSTSCEPRDAISRNKSPKRTRPCGT